jgi:hypothetical protein
MASAISSARLITSWFFQGNPFIKEIYNGFARVKYKDCAHNISQHVPANAVISVLPVIRNAYWNSGNRCAKMYSRRFPIGISSASIP